MPGHTDKKMGSGGMDIPAISREEQVMRDLPKGDVTTTDEELKRLNVEIIRPDINECFADFRTENGKFYYALGGIKAVGYAEVMDSVYHWDKIKDESVTFVTKNNDINYTNKEKKIIKEVLLSKGFKCKGIDDYEVEFDNDRSYRPTINFINNK